MSDPQSIQIPSLIPVAAWVRDIEKSRAFYKEYLGFDEPYVLRYQPANSDQLQLMVVIKLNDDQSIYLFPNAVKILPNGENMKHLGFATNAAAALRARLVGLGLEATAVRKVQSGDTIFETKDPDGYLHEVTQFEPDGLLMQHHGRNLPNTRISTRLHSITLAVANLDASLAYYCGNLGFVETGRKQPAHGAAEEVEVRFPQGSDCIVLRPYVALPGAIAPRAVPEMCFEVPDLARTRIILQERAVGGRFPPLTPVEVGWSGNRQASCTDPDGTKITFMEMGS